MVLKELTSNRRNKNNVKKKSKGSGTKRVGRNRSITPRRNPISSKNGIKYLISQI